MLLVGLGAALGHFQTVARSGNRSDLLSSILLKPITPIAIPIARLSNSITDFGTGIFHSRSLIVQNERLKSQLISLETYNERTIFLNEQVQQLRRALGLPTFNREKVALDVIGVSQLDNALILDGGSEKGIRPDLPVINGDGLVGIVQSVDHGECRVRPLTAYGVKVGGVDSSRQPPSAGLIGGQGTSTLTMLMYTPKSPVSLGDVIMTGGESQNVPAGLIVGHVTNVVEDEFIGTEKLTISPSFEPGMLHEVQVLK